MTNKEILGELKKCWEYLNDIDNNGNAAHCSGQLDNNQMSHIYFAMDELAYVYSDFRKTLDDEECVVNIKNKGTFYIGNDISEDYSELYDDENNYTYWVSCADLDYYWYEDNDFLDSDPEELYEVEVD